MKIFIYGDSNTWGYVPNIDGYSSNAIVKQYDKEDIWWYSLTKKHQVNVNGLCGRAISNENPWLEGRNASKTIVNDMKDIKPDLIIIQLGTNDCKSKYGLSAEDIVFQMESFLKMIRKYSDAKIMLISPSKIISGNKITDKYYIGGEEKSAQLDELYFALAEKNNYFFVSGLDLEVGEDGEHLTTEGHKCLGERIMYCLNNLILKKINR